MQAVVLGTVLLISTASALLGLTLLAASNAPFQHAFEARHGADLTVTVNTTHATANQLAATRTLPGVTGAAGPFTEATVQVSFDGHSLGPRVLAGRASPGGPVDDVVLSEGHWPDGPGQLVLDAGPGGGPDYPGLGDTVTVSGTEATSTLVVTGFAISITKTADGWVTPAEATRLPVAGTVASAQLLYRFATAATDDQVHADATEIARALPAGAVVGTSSWLAREQAAAGNAALVQPFVVGFALLGLAMSVLVTGNMVAGAVVAQYHRIGILKSVGLSPAQVAVVYLSRIGWPSLAGSLAGVLAGNLLAVPVLHDSSGIYGIGRQQVPWWVSLAALAGMLVLTVLAAAGPALGAGRLSAVQAIAAGRAPTVGRGYAAHRLAARLRLPRPVGIGLAAPFARPARTLVTLASITVGATAVIFAVGLNLALSRVEQSQTLSATAPVRVQKTDPRAVPSAAQNAAVTAALDAQPGTLRDVAVYGGPQTVTVPGMSKAVTAHVFGGNASWLGYALINGRWYGSPGEVDANTAFLADSGLVVGDTTTVDLVGTGTAPTTVRIVGEVFDPSNNPSMFTGSQTLPGLTTPANLEGYDIALRPGTDTTAYLRSVNQALGGHGPWLAGPPQANRFFETATALVDLLALMVAVAAGLGVLNTVLMTTRDKVHDLGIFKALGMRPGQLLTMVVCQVAGPAIVAAAIAAPAAVALTTATVQAMGDAARTAVPTSFSHVLSPATLALLSLAPLAIAAAGALLPASWAAHVRPATALRAE
ncbi:FtsX-like permease family protein [Actinoplanes subtropicus]|uniref:FtsX-like permease family protein n=1 Tax=Actinoplanes subtropicus TaxID=543632 RepID=UPI0014706353|nr:ABC transporter permease [Actinoplanes subtropicus]